MSRDRGRAVAGTAHQDRLEPVDLAQRPPIERVRQSFEHAVEMVERGISQRDYLAANYAMGRCRFHLAIHVDPAVQGPVRADEASEVDRLRALKARFERLRPLAPDGDEPSPAAQAEWLAKRGAPSAPEPATSRDEPRHGPATPVPSSSGAGAGEVVDAIGGPLFAHLRTREGLHQLFPPDPVYDQIEDTLGDLLNDPRFAAGFGIGAARGVYRAGNDLANAIPDTVRLIQELTASLIRSRAPLEWIAQKVDAIAAAPAALAADFVARWNASGSYERGSFRGEVTGYIVAQVAIMIATSGAGAAVAATGPYADVIQAARLLGDPIAVATMAGEIRVAAATAEAAQAVRAGGRAVDAASDLASEARVLTRERGPRPSLDGWMANKGTRLMSTSREQALRDLLDEAHGAGVVIHTDDEAQRLLDWAAAQEGVDRSSYHAVTIGDDIFVRPEHAENVRILREELIHVFQQRGGVSTAEIVEAEIAARLEMVRYRHRWGLTIDEVREMIREVRTMRRTGRY